MSEISIEDIKTLTEQSGNTCVSIYMPMMWTGLESNQNPVRYKNLVREMEKQLRDYGLPAGEIEDFLDRAESIDVEDEEFWQKQSQGFALFLSTDFLQYYRLPLSFDELVVINDRFHLKPLLPLLTNDGDFYILTLGQKQVRFLEATRYSVREVEVEGMPKSLDEALGYDETAKEGQFRIQTGKGGTSNPYPQPGSFHGQGSPDRDQHHRTLLQFFYAVDSALHERLHDKHAPLILVGVEYLLPLYREANTYPYLVEEGIAESAKVLTSEELHEQALPMIEPYLTRSREEAIERYRELSATEQTSTDLEETIAAAYYGRVDSVFVPIDRQEWGYFKASDNEIEQHETPELGDEDLLDTVAIQTLLHGGTVYAVEPDRVPDTAPVAAIFRY
ncbi:hypothetical protein V0288_21760 [Pannus brasiliensis CCIBt3594]|uniref:Uncharacterized protein n=2 Tax=Pannus TaxID=1427526 RepID=A0AAW9R1I6_9CHRO